MADASGAKGVAGRREEARGGASILIDFHAAVQNLHLHGAGSPIVGNGFAALRSRIDAFLVGEKKLEFRLHTGRPELNGAALPADSALQRAVAFLDQGLSRLGAKGFSFEQGISEIEIEAFASRLLKPRGGTVAIEGEAARLAGFSHLSLLAGVPEGDRPAPEPYEKVPSPRARAALDELGLLPGTRPGWQFLAEAPGWEAAGGRGCMAFQRTEGSPCSIAP